MINFRNIFNPDYNILGLLLIFLLIFLIFLNEKNLLYALKKISISILYAGIITLILTLILKLAINLLIPYQYKIFLAVITDNFLKNLITSTLIFIAIGIILYAFSKIYSPKSLK